MSAPTPPNEPILPRHADPQNEQRLSFKRDNWVYPYNFVPLPDAVMTAPLLHDGSVPWQKHDVYVPGLHSGWIELAIRAETPLYVRCAPPVEHAADEEPRTNRHRQEFFHQGDPQRPVLPGSSLRGMIRSLVEVLAHAKLTCGLFSDRRLIYRAVGDTASLGIHCRDAVLGPNQAQMPRHEVRVSREPPARRLPAPTRSRLVHSAGADGQRRNLRPCRVWHRGRARPPACVIQPDYGPQDLLRVFLRPPAMRTTPPRSNRNLTLNLAHVQNAADVVLAEAGTPCPNGFRPAVVVRSGHMPQKHMHCAIYDPDDAIPEAELASHRPRPVGGLRGRPRPDSWRPHPTAAGRR